ncbi:conjugal transfer protein TraD [Xenorhabdus sp. Flor]|uniref:Conjugal transfer protein TraD n=2 Tax=Xenorhabdus TaxID=626 RepID=A0AAW3YM60_9GAMM|nr:conjugal transfer protein TraD [Xenorhabdus sp. M]MBD2799118.1 conjugal transfer protein TraD [Xenorhabdus sp. M]MBD2813420.1 conjugal transfer protein TraD [Xenorhabdus sp. Flor]
MNKKDEWLRTRISYITGLKSPSEQQRLLVKLARIENPTRDEGRKLTVLIRAEKASERAMKAKGAAARVINAERLAARKARNHEMFKVAGLVSLAGLVDKKTGQLTLDAGTFVGALAKLADAPPEKLQVLKSIGDELIAEKEK